MFDAWTLESLTFDHGAWGGVAILQPTIRDAEARKFYSSHSYLDFKSTHKAHIESVFLKIRFCILFKSLLAANWSPLGMGKVELLGVLELF